MSWASKIAKGIDSLTGSYSTRYIINQIISEYGSIVNLEIDKNNKKIEVTLLLDGEILPVKIRIDKYDIRGRNGDPRIVLEKASADKAWVDTVMKNHVIGKPFNLPREHIEFVNEFL